MMVVAFDLDDTLYPEIEFVESGFRAVSRAAARAWGVSERAAYRVLRESLDRDGRGCQLDRLCQHFERPLRPWVARWLHVYRAHEPEIHLPQETLRVLCRLRDHPLYLVTDGHKGVQARKIAALGLGSHFRHCYLTNRYGRRFQKPSPHVFQLLCRRERCAAGEVAYIGDDPSKDFVGIRPLGFRTIRLRRGRHAQRSVAPGQDAEVQVDRLSEVPGRLEQLEADGR